jgi:hypothetical protein
LARRTVLFTRLTVLLAVLRVLFTLRFSWRFALRTILARFLRVRVALRAFRAAALVVLATVAARLRAPDAARATFA